MQTEITYGNGAIPLTLPDNALLYQARYPAVSESAESKLRSGIASPIGLAPLETLVRQRKPRDLVIVVSDITRPIPYHTFLPALISTLNRAGVPDSAITLVVATGMHRPSTAGERETMFGAGLVHRLTIEDHRADDETTLATLPQKSASGSLIRLNRHFLRADFRIVTGLVEPHFMAGFSGGRKSVCPGLSSLETLRKFHGAEFLSDPRSCNGNLTNNPLHEEALSVARAVGVDFLINVVLNKRREVTDVFAGELEAAHQEAIRKVREYACPIVREEADLVLTSCGGLPLDATFYQCVKGMVSCLPALKAGGTILAAGSCTEGIGGPEYVATMERFAGKPDDFLRHLRESGEFIKDQWQFQMQTRAIQKAGANHLHFYTSGIPREKLARLSVVPRSMAVEEIASALNRSIAEAAADGQTIAVIPEGPYCAPSDASSSPTWQQEA